jgi:hypothetical protein
MEIKDTYATSNLSASAFLIQENNVSKLSMEEILQIAERDRKEKRYEI